jgi:hypothetical protein
MADNNDYVNIKFGEGSAGSNLGFVAWSQPDCPVVLRHGSGLTRRQRTA